MKVIIKDGKPVVEGLPEENIILFFAKIEFDIGPPIEYVEYCVIFGPKDKCLPSEDENYEELWHAKIGIGRLNQEMDTYDVKHGHKYKKGGGFVETVDSQQIFFRLGDSEKPSTIEGISIRRENVFVVV